MQPKTVKLDIPKLMKIASSLPTHGKLVITNNSFIYLDISDDYIHQLFPLLSNKEIQKPDYFGEDSAGAHITVMYLDEGRAFPHHEAGKEHHFSIKELATAEINQKIYYTLLVDSPSLLSLRRKYKLPDLLCFKGYSVGFHITIGVKDNSSFFQ